MNVADDCRSELLVGARRGRLSDAARIALDAHLATCASCRMSRQVSADFDGAEAVDLHDGARIRAPRVASCSLTSRERAPLTSAPRAALTEVWATADGAPPGARHRDVDKTRTACAGKKLATCARRSNRFPGRMRAFWHVRPP